MQMGARWRHGSAPHRSAPATLLAAIAEQERRFPSADSWTLTWLEGRPRATLDDLVEVSIDQSGATVVKELGAGIASEAPSGARLPEGTLPDDDDDDWLN